MPVDPHVLHVFSSAGLYGAEHAVLGLIPALQGCGVQSSLLCIDNPHLREQPLYERARGMGIRATRIPCAGRFDRATTRALRMQLGQHPDAVLHVHGYKSTFYALRARQALPGVPIVATLHGWVTYSRALWLYRQLELRMLRRVQSVCIVTEAMREHLHQAGILAERIRLIENGIDTTRFHPGAPGLPRDELGIPHDAFVFGGMLRLSPEKNPLGLLAAFAQVANALPDAHLVLAGDGPQREAIQRSVHSHDLAGRVHLLGARNDPERIYPLFDCFVLPSLSEGLPLALLEAMACERPVVATRVGQIAAVVEGLPVALVRPGDTGELVHAMRLAASAGSAVAALRERVQARYSVNRMACDYAEVYRGLGHRHVDRSA